MVDEPVGSIVFVLHSHLPWVLGHGRWPHGEDWLYEAAAECYVPILRMMDRLARERHGARIAVGITPVLSESLASREFKEGFPSYLEERRRLAEADREDFRARGDRADEDLAAAWSEFYRGIADDFQGRYHQDLLAAFRRLQDSGDIEIITSAATHGYLPLLGRDESVAAQIRAGVASYRSHFGRAPHGFWLPECAYRPGYLWSRPVGPPRSWQRPGLERLLAREGLRYFFVDTHLVAGGVPLGTYEDRADEDLAAAWSGFYRGIADDFQGHYDQDLLAAFRRLQDSDNIEIITSAATHGYLPLLGRDESVAAQIRAGVASYRSHFGRAPQGFWLPECAYRPGYLWSRPVGPPRSWQRPGLERLLAREGLRYFFVDTHLVAGGVPLGTYEDRLEERRLDATRPVSGLSPNEVHALALRGTRSRLAVFARDPRSSVQVWSADYGYPGDGSYLEFHRKRGNGGLRYWRITDRRLPLDAKMRYDPRDAEARVSAHAEHFAGLVRDTLREHRSATGRPGVVVAPFDMELFGHWWFEGPRWLEAVLRTLARDVPAVTPSEVLALQPPRLSIVLPEGSWGQGGHHWVWLNDDTRWVWELVYRAEDAFVDAVRSTPRKPSEELRRVVHQLARELFLLEASDWPFLITTVAARDYAEARVRLHFETFNRLLAMVGFLREAPLRAQDAAWLAEVEARDSLFPHIDLRWWTGEARRR